jgi:hypothetical protein
LPCLAAAARLAAICLLACLLQWYLIKETRLSILLLLG